MLRNRRPLLLIVGVTVAVVFVLLASMRGCSSERPAPSKTFAARPTAGLAALLEPAPRFSGPGGSDWARDYTPPVDQFLEQFYAPKVRNTIRGDLREQGLQQVAHALWITDDQIQNDIVLLRFATADGAAQRLRFVKRTNDGNGELKSYTVTAPGSPVVYYTERPVTKGFLQAKAYAQSGRYVVEMFTYAAISIPRQQINTWLTAQLAILRSRG